MMQEIEAKIRKIITESVKTKVPVENIGLDDSLADFGINSMNFIKLIVEIENEFGFVFNNDTLRFENLNTINKLIDCINSLMK
jgi:acyl carrier protein